MFTSLWPLPTLYFIWMVIDWQTPERGKREKKNTPQASVKMIAPHTLDVSPFHTTFKMHTKLTLRSNFK